MNIYQLLKQRFDCNSVSLHVLINEDQSITTIVEPKYPSDAKNSQAPISITALTIETAMAKLIEALDPSNKQIKQEKTVVVEDIEADEKEEQKKKDEKEREKRAAEKKAGKKAKPAKKAEAIKKTKEQIDIDKKVEVIMGKLESSIGKKDIAIAKFWRNELGAHIDVAKEHQKYAELMKATSALETSMNDNPSVPEEIKEIAEASKGQIIIATIPKVEKIEEAEIVSEVESDDDDIIPIPN